MIELLMLHMFNMLMPAGYNLTGTNYTQHQTGCAPFCNITIGFGGGQPFNSMPQNTVTTNRIIEYPQSVNDFISTPLIVQTQGYGENITTHWGITHSYNKGAILPLWQQPPIPAVTPEQKCIERGGVWEYGQACVRNTYKVIQ